jgi:hypothetical protein
MGKMTLMFQKIIQSVRSLACPLVIAASIAILMPSLAGSQDSPPQAQRIWFWFGDCPDGKLMGVQVLLDGRTIYSNRFWMCLLQPSDVNSQRELDLRQTFYFRGGHTFQGKYRTTPSEQIEGDIWEASSDPSQIVFGVSFKDDQQALLNTTHPAKPGKVTSSTLDPGLLIKTFPLKNP